MFSKAIDHQTNSERVVKSAKLRQILKRNVSQVFEPQTEELRIIYKNIGDIKETMTQMLQSMNKAQANSSDKFALQNIECLQEYTPTSCLSLGSLKKKKPGILSTCFLNPSFMFYRNIFPIQSCKALTQPAY